MPFELKKTINLPQTAFPMKANLPQNEPKMLERWEQMGIYERIRQSPQRCAALHPARWASLHQRTDPHGHGPEQVPQGFHRQVKNHGGIRCPLRPRMGLPRPPHRDQGRQGIGRQEAADGAHRRARRLPQICAEISGPAAHAVQAHRRIRQVRSPVRHHDSAIRVGGAFHVLLVLRERIRLQGPARSLLVHARRDRAGRGGSRVRKPHQQHGLGEVPLAG